MIAGVFFHEAGQAVATIEHGQEDSGKAKLRIEASADGLDRMHQTADSLQRVKFALQRHDDAGGGDERIERQQTEAGRAVQNDHPERGEFREGVQGVPQPELALLGGDEFNFSTREIAIGGEQ